MLTKQMPLRHGYKSVLILLLIFFAGCKKDYLPENTTKQPLATMSGHVPLRIDLKEVCSQLPPMLLYNMEGKLAFYAGRTQWMYTDLGLTMRIPVTEDGYSHIYAVKTYADPDKLQLYLSMYKPGPGSTVADFSGRQFWINFQDWTAYGLKFEHNKPTFQAEPIKIAEPYLASCLLEHGGLTINGNTGLIGIDTTHMTTMDDTDCPGERSWFGRLLDSVGDFFSGIAQEVGDWWFNFRHPYDNGSTGGGGDGNGNGPGAGPGGPGGPAGPGPGGPGAGPGSGPGGPNPGNWEGPDPGGPSNPGGPGGTSGPPVLVNGNAILNGEQPIAINEIADENGFLPSRKAALQIYLQANPYGMLDCNELNSLPMDMFQQVGSYQVPQSVLNRLNSIRTSYPSIFNVVNFKIQSIQNAMGPIVNCDYFTVHITELPYNSNNERMTPAEFLESFRSNITFYASLGGSGTTFSPYIQSPFSDADRVLASYENSIGAIIHIEIPPVYDNGTVVESGYVRNAIANSHWFMFTTMTSPLDGEHPVAGNRKFGIFPDPNGGYCFYTMGVDRTNDLSTTFMNEAFSSAFTGADNLWHCVQDGVINYINSYTSNGQASLYNPRDKKARPIWNNVVKKFLQGQITLAQMKTALHCP